MTVNTCLYIGLYICVNHIHWSQPAIMIKVTKLLPTLHINKSKITLEAVLQQKGHYYLVARILHTAKSWCSMNQLLLFQKHRSDGQYWIPCYRHRHLFYLIQSESVSILLMCGSYSLFFVSILPSIPVNCNNLYFCKIIIFWWLTFKSEQWFIIKASEHSCPRQ